MTSIILIILASVHFILHAGNDVLPRPIINFPLPFGRADFQVKKNIALGRTCRAVMGIGKRLASALDERTIGIFAGG